MNVMFDSVAVDRQECFQFKTSFAPCTILQMIRYDLDTLKIQLAEAIQKAPTFFLGAPIIIDLDKIKSHESIDFARLKEILISNNVVPVGVRNGSQTQLDSAVSNGLPVLTIGKLTQNTENKKQDTSQQKMHSHQPTKVVNTPIRSGMQVYAKDADLIVTAPVSAGAELLADGHIHVYGPLRGRAMAGVQGNIHARIFCRTLEAELISIAGYYLTKDDMQPIPERHGMIQVYLDNEQVRIEMIS